MMMPHLSSSRYLIRIPASVWFDYNWRAFNYALFKWVPFLSTESNVFNLQQCNAFDLKSAPGRQPIQCIRKFQTASFPNVLTGSGKSQMISDSLTAASNQIIFPIWLFVFVFFFRWLLLAGGITLQNSPNSLTPFSLIFVKRLNMFLYSMSSITDVCHSRYGSASNSLQVIFFLQYLIIFINSFWSCFHLGSTNENHTVWMVNFIWIVPVYGWP